VSGFQDSMLAGKDSFTGLLQVINIRPAFDLILRRHPDTNKIIVVSDSTTISIANRKHVADVARQFEELKFEYYNGEDLSTAELIRKLGMLQDGSIVFLITWLRDNSGSYTTIGGVYPEIVSHSTAPIYTMAEMNVGLGPVGGFQARYYTAEKRLRRC